VVNHSEPRANLTTPRATGNFGYITRPRATGALRAPLKPAVAHLSELALILEAGGRPAEARAANRIAGELGGLLR
jgi:hypothetical protein